MRIFISSSASSLPGDDAGEPRDTLEAGQTRQGLVPGAQDILLVLRQLPEH